MIEGYVMGKILYCNVSVLYHNIHCDPVDY